MSLLTDIIIKYWPVFPAVFVAGVVDAIAGGGGLISLLYKGAASVLMLAAGNIPP